MSTTLPPSSSTATYGLETVDGGEGSGGISVVVPPMVVQVAHYFHNNHPFSYLHLSNDVSRA